MAQGISRLRRAPAMAAIAMLMAVLACAPPTPLALGRDCVPEALQSGTTPECRLHFLEVADLRSDKTALGTVAGRPVRAPGDTRAWLEDILKTMSSQGVGVTFQDTGNRPEGSLMAEAQLLTAWVNSISTSMAANVVIRVRYQRQDGAYDERLYRGSCTALNWNSGDSEIRDLLSEAFSNALGKVAADAKGFAHPTPAGNQRPTAAPAAPAVTG